MVDHITPSFLAHADFFRTHRDRVYIISGGFDEIILPAAEALGIDPTHIFANAFIYDMNGVATGVDQERPSAHAGGKVRAVEEAGLPHPRVIVGDGWTDFEIKQKGAADAFIAYVEHAHRDKVVAEADVVARSFDDLVEYLEA